MAKIATGLRSRPKGWELDRYVFFSWWHIYLMFLISVLPYLEGKKYFFGDVTLTCTVPIWGVLPLHFLSLSSPGEDDLTSPLLIVWSCEQWIIESLISGQTWEIVQFSINVRRDDLTLLEATGVGCSTGGVTDWLLIIAPACTVSCASYKYKNTKNTNTNIERSQWLNTHYLQCFFWSGSV